MKRFFLIVSLLWVALPPTHAQDQVNKPSPALSPKPPNTAALGRFGEHPVSLNTGVPSISVPVFDITAGQLRVPVSLDYHAGGYKVTDRASWVGLGWALTAGGSISRTVIGRPDEQGILTSPLNTALNPSITSSANDCTSMSDQLDQYNNNVFDTGYDVFILALPGGRTLRYILVPDGSGSEATTMPFERVKINVIWSSSVGSAILGFTVIDEDGIIYTFDQSESVSINSGSNTPTYTSAWQLSRMQANRPDDAVQFTYTTVAYGGDIDVRDTFTIVDQVSGDCSSSNQLGNRQLTTANVYVSHTFRQLQTIVFPGGKLVFVPEGADRVDLPSSNKALDYIVVYGYNTSSRAYQPIKRVDLQQTYFPDLPAAQQQYYSYLRSPLKLDAVLMQDANNSLINSYLFAYNTAQNMPGQLSRSRDAWGYNNGEDNSASLVPLQTVTLYNTIGTDGTTTIGSAKRTCNETYMQAWILNKVTYPTGGNSKFFYEANRYLDPATNTVTLAGGLRVTRIETQASVADSIKVKSYKYGAGESGYGDLNVNLNKSIWSNTYAEQVLNDCKKQTRIFGSTPTASVTPFDGSPVTYAEVAEYEGTYSGGTLIGNANGKTVYTFKTSGDIVFGVGNDSKSGKTFVASYHWDRGQPLTKAIYAKGGQLLYRQVNTYGGLVRTSVSNAGVLIYNILNYTSEWSSASSARLNLGPCEYLRTRYAQPTYYPWPKGNIRLLRTDEYNYPAANGNAVVTSMVTDYNADFQPISQRFTGADGSISTRRIRYPFDYSVPTPASGPTRGIQLLQTRGQRNVVVEEYAYRQASTAGSTYLTGGQVNLFEENSLVTGYALPKETHRLQVLDRCCLASSYVPMTLTASQTTKDSRYGLELTYTGYDYRANPTEYLLRNGLRTRLSWVTLVPPNNTPSAYFSVLTSETANYNTPNSLTTQYAYDVPLLGIKSQTDPNGLATRYEYDTFGRLDAVRDHDQNLIKTLDYNYANGEQNPKRLAPFSTVNSSVSTGCFLIYNVLSGKVMQAMTDNTVQQQTPIGGQTNQIWRFDLQSGSQYKLTVQNGTGLVAQTNTVNEGELIRVGSYSGTSLQVWNFNETGANSRQYRVSLPAGTTWDVTNGGAGPGIQVYGNMNNPGDYHYNQPYRFFQLLAVGCPGGMAPVPTLSASPAAVCPGQTATLTASGCSGGTVTWSNGVIGTTLTVNSSGTYMANCTLNGNTSTNGQVTVQPAANCAGGSPAGNGCFVISSIATGKVMQVMGDNTVQQQPVVNGQANQIWKFDLQGNGQYKLTSQNGSSSVASAPSAGDAQLIQLTGYTNASLQLWTFTETATGSGQYRVSLSAGNTWDLRSRGVGPELQLYGSLQNTTDPDFNGTYRQFKLTAVGCPTSPNCYSLRLVGNGNRLTNANGVLKIQTPNDADNGQIFRLDPTGTSVKITTMNGSGLVVGAANGNQTQDTELVMQSPNGQSHQLWTQQPINDGNSGLKYGFVTSNGSFAWSSWYGYGAGNPATPTVSDLQLKPVADMSVYGWMKWYVDNRVCPF